MPITIGMLLVALAPILVLLVLMLVVKMGASTAAPISLGVALVGAAIFYKATPGMLLLEALKGMWGSLTVILVVFTALLLYEVSNQANAFATIQPAITKMAPNELVRILGIGLVFVSFLQGVTGFGVPVAVCAPLLLSIGVKPLWAVIIPLLGHAWAGTFGTLALAWEALIVQAGVTDDAVVLSTALFSTMFLFAINFVFSFAICFAYGRWQGLKKGAVPVMVLTTLQGGGQILFSQFNQTLACFLPTCFALLGFLVLGRIYKTPWVYENSPVMDREHTGETEIKPGSMKLGETFLPYVIMTGITLLVLLSPLKNILGIFKVGFAFPETSTGFMHVNPAFETYAPFSPLTHASFFLLLSALISFFYYKKRSYIKSGAGKEVLHRALKKAIPSSIAVICLMTMARVMGGSGQIMVMATFTSAALQSNYAIFAPLIGLLGTFITSSNMSSNVLFAEFQMQTSQILSLNPAVILGAQTGAGSIGTAISPGNVVLGATTAGILGSEGKILRIILPLALGLTILFGLAAWLIA